jgi:hypothetical protein
MQAALAASRQDRRYRLITRRDCKRRPAQGHQEHDAGEERNESQYDRSFADCGADGLLPTTFKEGL